MSAWTDLGLPLPNANGYGYTRDAALLRIPFDCAMPDQGQRNTNWRKTFNVSWNLTLEQLNLACQYLLSVGFSWFDLELVSNETPIGDLISIHQIRLTSSYNIKPIGGIYFELSANIESRVTPVSCTTIVCDTETNFDEPICNFNEEIKVIVATTLYPIEILDEFTSNALVVSGHLSPKISDAYTSQHVFTSGDVIAIKNYVNITQTDAYTSQHVFTSGEIIQVKNFVNVTQTDAYTSQHVFTYGDIIRKYIAVTVYEDMTSTAIIVSGTLE